MNHKAFKKLSNEMKLQAPPRPKEYQYTFRYNRAFLKAFDKAKIIYNRMPHNKKDAKEAVQQALRTFGR